MKKKLISKSDSKNAGQAMVESAVCFLLLMLLILGILQMNVQITSAMALNMATQASARSYMVRKNYTRAGRQITGVGVGGSLGGIAIPGISFSLMHPNINASYDPVEGEGVVATATILPTFWNLAGRMLYGFGPQRSMQMKAECYMFQTREEYVDYYERVWPDGPTMSY